MLNGKSCLRKIMLNDRPYRQHGFSQFLCDLVQICNTAYDRKATFNILKKSLLTEVKMNQNNIVKDIGLYKLQQYTKRPREWDENHKIKIMTRVYRKKLSSFSRDGVLRFFRI